MRLIGWFLLGIGGLAIVPVRASGSCHGPSKPVFGLSTSWDERVPGSIARTSLVPSSVDRAPCPLDLPGSPDRSGFAPVDAMIGPAAALDPADPTPNRPATSIAGGRDDPRSLDRPPRPART